MPKLEICNSVLTNNAGEWAMLFYARDQGAHNLEDITALDLSGKGVMYMESADVFGKMTSLRRLDLSEHPEFFMCEEKKEAVEFEKTMGIDKETRSKVEFTEFKLKIDDLLSNLNSLEEIICDNELEAYILEQRGTKQFLPKLKLVNEVSIEIANVTDRIAQRKATAVFNKLQRVAGHYSIGGALQI